MKLSQSYIDSLAPNSSGISNGKALLSKLYDLSITEDDTLIFGKCKGSGKTPYACSVDFIDKDNPIARCSCPSRQIPCKHAMGLMYAFAEGKAFTTAEIPDDVASKRDKIANRAETKEKKAQAAKSQEKKPPTKAKLTAARKRMSLQLEGIENASLLVHNILQAGISGIDTAALKNLEGQAKNLGNYHINGIQTAFLDALIKIKGSAKGGNSDNSTYDDAIGALLYLNALLSKAKDYLTAKHDGEDAGLLTLDTTTAIEEQIGHIWNKESLLENGMYIENAQLAQLAFYVYDDLSRREYVDQGFYFCFNDQRLYNTYNYRPYKAAKYVKEDDTLSCLIETPELYVYPGNVNPRVRHDRHSVSELTSEHYGMIKSAAKVRYAEVIKTVKNQMMSPLADKNPLSLLEISDIACNKDGGGATHVHVVDRQGFKLALSDEGYINAQSVPLFKRLDKSLLIGNAALVMFVNNAETGILSAKPLAVVTDSGIIKLI